MNFKKIKPVSFFLLSFVVLFFMTSCGIIDNFLGENETSQPTTPITRPTDGKTRKKINLYLDNEAQVNEDYIKSEISKMEDGLNPSLIHFEKENWFLTNDNKLRFNAFLTTYSDERIIYEVTVNLNTLNLNNLFFIVGKDSISYGNKENMTEEKILENYKVVNIKNEEISDAKIVFDRKIDFTQKGHFNVFLKAKLNNGKVISRKLYIEATAQFNVIYKDSNDNVLYEDVVDYNKSSVYEGETPTKESTDIYDYVFDKWSKDTTHVTEDLVLKPIFKSVMKTFNVTFIYNGESKTVNTKINASLQLLIPSIPGYTIEGYYSDPEYNVPFNINDSVKKDLTIYIKTKISDNVLTVKTIDYDGTETTIDEIPFDINNPYNLSEILKNKPVLDYQIFSRYKLENNVLKLFYKAQEYTLNLKISLKLFEKDLKEDNKTFSKSFKFTAFNLDTSKEKALNIIKNEAKTKLNKIGDDYFDYQLDELNSFFQNGYFENYNSINVYIENKTQGVEVYNPITAEQTQIMFGKGNITNRELTDGMILENKNFSKETITQVLDLSYVSFKPRNTDEVFYLYYMENDPSLLNLMIENPMNKENMEIIKKMFSNPIKPILRKEKLSDEDIADIKEGNMISFYSYFNNFENCAVDVDIKFDNYMRGVKKINKIEIKHNCNEQILINDNFIIKEQKVYRKPNSKSESLDFPVNEKATKITKSLLIENYNTFIFSIPFTNKFYHFSKKGPEIHRRYTAYYLAVEDYSNILNDCSFFYDPKVTDEFLNEIKNKIIETALGENFYNKILPLKDCLITSIEGNITSFEDYKNLYSGFFKEGENGKTPGFNCISSSTEFSLVRSLTGRSLFDTSFIQFRLGFFYKY